jgi:hypothetical protein
MVTLAHAPGRILMASLDRLYATRNADTRLVHHVLDGHYPINPTDSFYAVREACRRHRLVLHDAGRNLGLHHGFNLVWERIRPADEDVVILYDPDSYPLDPGWDMALVTAVTHGRLAVAGLVHPVIEQELVDRAGTEELVDGYLKVALPKRECQLSVCAFSGEFLRHTGGFHEPNAFYGGLEADMWARLDGRRWGYLPQYREDHRLNDLQDWQYREWKRRHAQDGTFPGGFDEFVRGIG